jgi:serine acetyltransferase
VCDLLASRDLPAVRVRRWSSKRQGQSLGPWSQALRKLRADAERFSQGRRFSPAQLVVLLANPGYRALVLLRLQEGCTEKGWGVGELLLSNLNLLFSGADFRPGAVLGPGTVIRHPQGIVIGSGVRVGSDCVLTHGVTLGLADIRQGSDGAYPTVGNSVVLGAYSVILGAVHVGDGATVGALTIVTHDVPPSATVVGQWNSDSA